VAKYGLLIDETRCTGCRGCQVACKQWNDLEGTETKNTGSYTNPPSLNADTWMMIDFKEVEVDGELKWSFLNRRCMHCEHPACVSACPVGALKKHDDGPVLWNEDRCIGCRYCMVACPFDVPTFTWDAGLAEGTKIRKCNLCIDRISNGLEPACVKTCPTGALVFGGRDDMIALAEDRLASNPDKYHGNQGIYGLNQAGGTTVLYISHTPFEQMGLPTLGDEAPGHISETIMKSTPIVAVGWASILAGVWWVIGRRNKALSKNGPPKQGREE
jgi:formate dehydrogenase iron-sulfur subunit